MLRGRGGWTHFQHQTHLPPAHVAVHTAGPFSDPKGSDAQRHSEATNGNCSLNQCRGTQHVTQRSQDRIMCVSTRGLLGWERIQPAPLGTVEKNWNVLLFTQPSTTLRTDGCVISSYWMTLNKGSRSSCDGCIQSFNKLIWTNNYPLQFRENYQKKEKRKKIQMSEDSSYSSYLKSV